MRSWVHRHAFVDASANVRMYAQQSADEYVSATRLCEFTDAKIPCLHISAALSAPFPVTLPGERREGRGEELAVTPVPRTSSGPIRQLKLDVCALSASSNC